MYAAILLLPLLGAIIAGFMHRVVTDQGAIFISTGMTAFTAVLSWIVFFTFQPGDPSVELFRWIASGELETFWSIRVDRLTSVMLVVITTVSTLVQIYSIGFTRDGDHPDPTENFQGSARSRFFACLCFFTFAMLALVTGDNLLQIFFGWEGVGFASYLLIGFWFRKSSAGSAAIKAFVVNRVGDFGLLLGLFGLFHLTGSLMLDDVFADAEKLAEINTAFLGMDVQALELICLLLFVGACAKSAQFLLHTWLSDATEGPAPVTALIHSATMAAAGVFLVCRMSPLFDLAETALLVMTIIGAVTAVFAASIGSVQTDIKRVIAYSSCAQIGYMFAAAGAGVYQAAMLHMFAHAFFIALLALGAGSVVRSMQRERDMRRMGGLKSRLPVTYWMMIIGTLAVTGIGVPLLHIGVPIGVSGFISKGMIIQAVFVGQNAFAVAAFGLLVLGVVMTSFLSWRLIFMTFHGTSHADQDALDGVHDGPQVMRWPLYVLAAGAVLAGMAFYGSFVGNDANAWWGGAMANAQMIEQNGETTSVLEAARAVPIWVKVSPFLAMLLGFALSYWFYIANPDHPKALAERYRPLYLFLQRKWYFDPLYNFLFIRPALWLGQAFWQRGDRSILDGFLNGTAMWFVPLMTRVAGRMQSGFLFHYALVMLIGVSALITWFAIGGGG
ncbi:MAG: NADH-quinone oxidoreductase subunit L [Pseudomonadota bacterium]